MAPGRGCMANASHAQDAAHQCAAHGATGSTAPSQSGEEIDLNAIGPDSSVEENAQTGAIPLPAEPARSLRPSPAQSLRSAQPSVSKNSNNPGRAEDVWFFFTRGNAKENKFHICTKCSK